MRSVTFHDQAYELYSWQDFGEHVFALAKKIIESGQVFDRIIALAKGGTAIARPLADLCDIHELSSIQIEFYTGIGTTAKTPVITQSLPVKIKDERVLLIDDIADSGETLTMATTYIRHHGVRELATATLVTKPWTTFSPDFSQHKSKAWVIFPWEAHESIKLLSAIWKEKGDTETVVLQNLANMGFSQAEIATFAPPLNVTGHMQ